MNISDEEGVSSILAYGLFLGDFWDNRIVSMEIFIIPDNFYNVSSGVVNIPFPHVDPVNISDEEGVSSIPADVFLRGSIISSKVLGDFNNAFSGVVNIPFPHVDSVNISDEEGVSSIPASGFHP